jgi:hypothetical protein
MSNLQIQIQVSFVEMFFNINAKEKVFAVTLLYYIIRLGLIDRKLVVVRYCNARFRDIDDCYFNDGNFDATTAIVGLPTYRAPIQQILTIISFLTYPQECSNVSVKRT